MIAEVLVFFRDYLEAGLRVAMGGGIDDPVAEKVVFIDGSQTDPIQFQLDAVTELLINVEEERVLRNADPHVRRTEDGQVLRVQPDIRLNLYLLFVARFKSYETAWTYLSSIIEQFQSKRVFDSADPSSGLPPSVDKLIVELVTLGLAEQNEIWNALRTTHLPSILYRVRLVVVRDLQATEAALVSTISNTVKQLP